MLHLRLDDISEGTLESSQRGIAVSYRALTEIFAKYTVRTQMGNFNAGGNRAGAGHNFSSVLLEGHIGP